MRISTCGLIVAVLLCGCATGSRTAPLAAPPSLDNGAGIVTLQPYEMAAQELAQRYGAERVLVVYDVDNTLLASRIALGSDQWFDWQADGAQDGVAISSDFDCLLAAQGVLFHLGDMRLTHPGVAFAVRRLQDSGHPSLVLTSRGPEFVLSTHRELRRNGLDFSRRPLPGADRLTDLVSDNGLERGTWLPYRPGEVAGFSAAEVVRFELTDSGGRPRPVRYEDGVFFTSGQHKGAMLRVLLERLGLTDDIDAVVFADDKQKHVDAMTDALTAIGKDVVAYHYEAERDAVQAFDMNLQGIRADTSAQWCTVTAMLPGLQGVFGADNYAGARFAACARGWVSRCTLDAQPSF